MRVPLPAAVLALIAAAPAMAQERMDHAAMDHGSMDHGAMHSAAAPAPPAPPADPGDWAADALHDPAAMAAARKALFAATSDTVSHLVLVDRLEWQARRGRDGIAWSGKASWGGDLDRLLIRTEGKAAAGKGVESAELRALWSHAVGPYANLELGVRQDLQAGPGRTYATAGIDAMLPYWIEAEGALFLSHKGELLARAEFSHDMRLTRELILQPRAGFNLAAQDVPALGIGSGLSDMETGLRLRWTREPGFAPYLGVEWSRKFGKTTRLARLNGDAASATRVVAGLRFWF